MGRYDHLTERSGFSIPVTGSRLTTEQIDALLAMTRSGDSRERRLAAKNLCTCHVRSDNPQVAETLLSLFDDPDPGVRGDVLHALTDSTPHDRVPVVVAALERHWGDPDQRLRRRIRKTLTYYRRTGKLTDAVR